MEVLFVYLVIGAGSGLLGGLLGLGGGLVTVPALAAWFAVAGHGEAAMHLAVGTSLAVIPFTLASAVVSHARRGAVAWPLLKGLVPGAVLGGLAGALLVGGLDGARLAVLFGTFLILVALWMALGRKPAPGRQPPGRAGQAMAGGVIGLVAAPMGVAGGTLTVPWLAWHNIPLPRAVATSAALGLPIALAGVAGFLITGSGVPGRPEGATGWVYLPAVAALAPAAILTAPLGARLAHALPVTLLRRIFAGFLVVVGLRMMIG